MADTKSPRGMKGAEQQHLLKYLFHIVGFLGDLGAQGPIGDVVSLGAAVLSRDLLGEQQGGDHDTSFPLFCTGGGRGVGGVSVLDSILFHSIVALVAKQAL